MVFSSSFQDFLIFFPLTMFPSVYFLLYLRKEATDPKENIMGVKHYRFPEERTLGPHSPHHQDGREITCVPKTREEIMNFVRNYKGNLHLDFWANPHPNSATHWQLHSFMPQTTDFGDEARKLPKRDGFRTGPASMNFPSLMMLW